MELQVGCCRPPEHFRPGAGALPAGQQNRQRTAVGRNPRRVGRHRTRLPCRRTPRTPSTPTPRTRRPCWAGSPSTSATHGSATGSTPQPANASGWSPRSPKPRSASEPCAGPWRSSSPTAPAGSSPRNCTSNILPWQRRGGGYASRPGGARAKLLAKVNKHETEHNLELIWTEIRNLQQGIMPAGPGARALTDFSPPPTSGPANDARSPCSTSCRGCGYPRSSPLRSAPPKSRSPSPTR